MGFLDRRRQAQLEQHRQGANWPMLAATMLLGHETQLAKEEGWDESVLVMRLVTIRDGVLAEIGGFDYFTDVLIETDFEMRTSDKDRVLDTALERSGYNATRSRLFPPGTEIVEYTEDYFQDSWTSILENLSDIAENGGDGGDWRYVCNILIGYLVRYSRVERDDPQSAKELREWYPQEATPRQASEAVEQLDQDGQQPSRDQALRFVRELVALMNRPTRY